MDGAMRRHLNNLSRQVGGDVTDRYRFITSSDELYKSFMESKADLRYALKKETKRDRYVVMNSEALSRSIQEACAQALESASEPLGQYIEGLAYDIFSGFGSVSATTKKSSNSFIKIFTKLFIKNVFRLFERNSLIDN